MSEAEEHLLNANSVPVTPNALRAAAAQAELRGDWHIVELLVTASDRLLQLEAQNQAYRHALASGVSINFLEKRKRFTLRKD